MFEAWIQETDSKDRIAAIAVFGVDFLESYYTFQINVDGTNVVQKKTQWFTREITFDLA